RRPEAERDAEGEAVSQERMDDEEDRHAPAGARDEDRAGQREGEGGSAEGGPDRPAQEPRKGRTRGPHEAADDGPPTGPDQLARDVPPLRSLVHAHSLWP